MNDAYPLVGHLAPRAREGVASLATATGAERSLALRIAANYIREQASEILVVNESDYRHAKKRGVSASFLDRMYLDEARIEDIASALEEIADQDDPIGQVIERRERPNGLVIERVRVPIGVIGIIFESRPNVTTDAAAICIMSGNAVILRSGTDCLKTAIVLHKCIERGLVAAGISPYAVQIIEMPDRDAVGELLSGLGGTVDLVIPRGGKSLVGRVQKEARVPTLSHLDGICHVYVDKAADHQKAIDIVVNSKMRRTGVCGAAETLLIDDAVASVLLPEIVKALVEAGCEIRGDASATAIIPTINSADEIDFETEYLDAIISIAVVEGVEGALAHLARFSSCHTDSIVTEDGDVANRFLTSADSAILLHNASTQFADGGEFGLGAEIGIATGKLHVRGPVGVKELTTYKNVVYGVGQIRP